MCETSLCPNWLQTDVFQFSNKANGKIWQNRSEIFFSYFSYLRIKCLLLEWNIKFTIASGCFSAAEEDQP